MIQIEFSQEQQDELFNEFRQDENGNIRIRCLALYLKSKGLAHETIGDICRISRPTLSSYLKFWQKGGKGQLTDVKFYRPKSELMEYAEELKKHFETHPPRNSNEAKEKIKEITGIERCPTQVRIFMKEIGMKIRKVGFIPGKASTPQKQEEQDSFKKNSGTFSGKG
jgi:transposase